MKAHTYTKRELKIVKTKKPLPISCEEYLALYHKAFCRGRIQTLNHMIDTYPDIAELVVSEEFEETYRDPADMESGCLFPILLSTTRYTQARVMDMAAYLLGKVEAPEKYAKLLRELVPFRLVFNYFTEEYVEDFLAAPLWENYFLGRAELRRVLEVRSIGSLDELVTRAADYFERLWPYQPFESPVSSRAECGNERPQGAAKPRRQACSTKQRQRILSGAWGVPNKQSKHTCGGRGVE